MRLGSIDPDKYHVNEIGIWYLIGYFRREEIPEEFFDLYVLPRRSRTEIKKHGQDAKEKRMLLRDDPELKHANP